MVWTLLQDVLNLYEKHGQWVENQEQILKDIDSRGDQKSQEQIQDLITMVEVSTYLKNLLHHTILFIKDQVDYHTQLS